MDKKAPKFSDLIRPIRRVLRIVVVAFTVLALAPISLLAITARTGSGRLAGWAALSAIVAIVMTVVAVRSASRDVRHFVAVVLPVVAFVGLVVLLFRGAPGEISTRTTGLLSVFPDPSIFHCHSVWNLIPEVDAVTLGVAILTRLDPWISTEQARRTRRILNERYEEMAAAPETRSLGTVANYAMAELLGGSFQKGTHYYAYIPAHLPNERLGMLVFLHGNAGNHQVMAWAWKPFADQHKVAIVCPTFGFGFWDDGGVEAVERVYQHAVSTLTVDPTRVWLGGISDGGKGVTRSAAAHAEHYGGLIYISPTMVLPEVGSLSFLERWKGRPVILFQGEADHNVLKRDVDPAVELMCNGSIDVIYQTFPGEDHFLFFARRAEIFEIIAKGFNAAHH